MNTTRTQSPRSPNPWRDPPPAASYRPTSSASGRRSASAPPARTPEALAVWHPQNVWAEESNFGDALRLLTASPRPLTGRLPRPGAGGMWGGRVGDGAWHPHGAEVAAGTGGRPVQFFSGYPDFSPWAVFVCRFDDVAGTAADFTRADAILQRAWNLPNVTATRRWRREHAYTWHHHEDARTLLLVPRAVHGGVAHAGGASRARRGSPPLTAGYEGGWQEALLSSHEPPLPLLPAPAPAPAHRPATQSRSARTTDAAPAQRQSAPQEAVASTQRAAARTAGAQSGSWDS